MHSLDVFSAVEINVDEIAFAEVIVAMLDEVVLSEAAFESNALLPAQLVIGHRVNLQRGLAEGDRVAKSRRQVALLEELIELLLI